LRQARRFSFLAAGRRWRKTTLLMAIAVERALRGQIGIWGAPTYDQVRIGWREMYRAVGGVAQCSRSTMTVTYPTNGMVIFR